MDELMIARFSDPRQLLHALRCLAGSLRLCGWELFDASINGETGFVRLIAEARDLHKGEGVKLTILGSTRGSVVIERSRIIYREGFYSSGWEVADHIGTDRVERLGEAVAVLVHYVCDNGSGGALSQALADRRRKMLERDLAMVRPAPESGAIASHSIGGEPLTEEWLRECDRACQGDGWDPYIPSVTAGSDTVSRTWVSASGLIVDGRGVHREGTFARGPLS